VLFRRLVNSVNEPNIDPQTVEDAPDGVQDDFSVESDVRREERRLHLQAFDYWHKLKADRDFPLFTELRPEDLAPFKANSLLVEFNQNGTVVRFLGHDVSAIIDTPLQTGSYLADFPDSSFARALLDQFSDEQARARAAEFEFIEEQLSCRGMMLPFSRDGSGAHFVMVVASFRRMEATPVEASSVDDNVDALDGLLNTGQRAADSIVHMDNGNRTSLYGALASALALYEGAQDNPIAYSKLLENAGLKGQVRAPFTPILKLIFGADYDKTRLTEYAAAIAYAVRHGENSDSLTNFLVAMPGGIKGCVQEERIHKRREAGTPAYNRQKEAEETLRHTPSVPLKDMTPNDEFCLILARRSSGGDIEALGCPDVSQATLDAAVRQIASLTRKIK